MSCNQCVLDVGTGRGYLIPVIRKATTKVIAMDLSVRMLSFINPWPSGAMRVCASAFDLPFASNSFNLVTSSLADPFLREEALNEILRILVDGGFFIFSSPSKIWSDAIRKTDDDTRIITRFVNSAGLEATVYSFTYTDDQLRNLLISCGYHIEVLETVYGKNLKDYNRWISPDLVKAADRLAINLEDIPILQLVVARKATV